MIVALALLLALVTVALVAVVAIEGRNKTRLEARLTALALARTPNEYAGLLRAEETAKRSKPAKTRRGREEDDRDRPPTQPIGLGGDPW